MGASKLVQKLDSISKNLSRSDHGRNKNVYDNTPTIDLRRGYCVDLKRSVKIFLETKLTDVGEVTLLQSLNGSIGALLYCDDMCYNNMMTAATKSGQLCHVGYRLLIPELEDKSKVGNLLSFSFIPTIDVQKDYRLYIMEVLKHFHNFVLTFKGKEFKLNVHLIMGK
uniref:Trafficking protein particle complex subunit n=1 Tax=Strongyloides papillosus TaxID=174720 RepID=A0A0N5C6I0_STREA